MTADDYRNTLARHLLTDLLLGARSAPLRLRSAPRPARTPATAASAGAVARQVPPPAPRQAVATRSTTPPSGPIVALQNISEAELARRRKELTALDEQQVKLCRKCGLCHTRTNTVFGQGHPAARLVFVGEAPGADEDAQGLAFVGRAGQLLTKMIEAMGVTRDQVFICNILKCRPPNNREPAPDEISACWPYLDKQLQIIQPEVIVALGKPASQTLLRTSESIGRLRGRWHEYYTSGMVGLGPATHLMPTYHPAYLLRNPSDKGKTWSDLKMVMQRLGWPIPQSSAR